MYLGEILLQNISGFICLPFNGGGGNSYCLFNFIQTNLHKLVLKGRKYVFDFYTNKVSSVIDIVKERFNLHLELLIYNYDSGVLANWFNYLVFPFFDQFDLETWESCVNYKTLPETLQIKIFRINFFWNEFI